MSVLRTRPLRLVAIAAVVALSAAGGVVSWTASAAEPSSTERVIIELAGAPALSQLGAQRAAISREGAGEKQRRAATEYRAIAASVLSRQNSTLAIARGRGIAVASTRHVVGVLNAVIGTIAPADLPRLRALPGVVRVTVDTQLHALGVEGSQVGTALGVPAGSSRLSTTPMDARAGAGSTVAILDTGADYNLADLGGGFGAGFKVEGGYDFVNGDADPMDDNFHGTHVAGIVAGTGADSVTGVAPGADLMIYKVLDERGEGALSAIVEGLEAATDPAGAHPANVINMSLGGDGDGTDPLSVAAENATLSGALVVAAAGNSGPSETTIGSPASAPDVLSVGASVTDYSIAAATMIAPVRHELVGWRVAMSANAPKHSETADVVDVGRGTAEDFDAAGDVTGKIVIYRGPAPLSSNDQYAYDALQTAQLAESRGAIGALVWDKSAVDQENAGGGGVSFRADPSASSTDVTVPASSTTALASGDDFRLDKLVMFGMTYSEYTTFNAEVLAGGARMTISSVDATDRIAAFSSRGPTRLGQLKPEIVAPGVEIRSTVPAAQDIPGNAFRLSGTSMASPAVAGAAAIAHAEHPDFGPKQLRALLIGSAAPLAGVSANLSPSTKGAGRVSVAAATAASVLALPATLGFGQASAVGDPSTTLAFDLTDFSTTALTARLEVQPSEDSAGKLTLDEDNLEIAPGESVTVRATATAKVGASDSELSGVIIARLSDGTDVRIPYIQLSRHLTVSSTPEPTTGAVQVMVTSYLPLDAPPILTVTSRTGAKLTVTTSPSSSLPGWYRADLSQKAVGVYSVSAAARTRSKAIAGSGSFEVVSNATSSSTWQQIGRNASADQLAMSRVRAGTAMQLASTSVRPFVTTDFGKSWRQVRSLPVADGVGLVIADPTNSKAFWYPVNGAVGVPANDPSYDAKLLRTTDLGRTWSVMPMPDKHFSAFASSGNTLVAVTADGLEISTNGGRKWTHRAYVWESSVSDAVIQNGILFVSGMSSVWRVRNILKTPSTPSVVFSNDSFAITGIDADRAMVVVGTSSGGVFVSTSGGTRWKKTSLNQDTYTWGITIVRGTIYAGGLQGYLTSANRGTTWRAPKYPLFGGIANDFDSWPGRTRSLVMSLSQAGVYSSSDLGKGFRRIGVAATSVMGVMATTNVSGKATVYLADEQGVGSAALPTTTTVSAGATEWGVTGGEAKFGVAATAITQDAVNRATLWRTRLDAFGQATIQASVNGAKSWTVVGPQTSGLSISSIVASPTVSGHVVASYSTQGGDTGIVVTHDGWQTWDTYSYEASIRSIAFDPTDESRLWIASDQGLYRSDDGGHTVTKVFTGELHAVWVDPTNPGRILAGGRGLWFSTDGGASFARADVGGADQFISSFAGSTYSRAHGVKSPIMFAGSTTFRPGPLWVHGRGVLASIDGGATWVNVSAGIGSTSILSMDTSSDGKWLLVGARQGGLYRAPVATLARAALAG
jgi:subtilisin family serine protease